MVTVEAVGGKPELSDLVLRRDHGRNLSEVMGRLLFKEIPVCIAELVANAHDADAERVDIHYDPTEQVLSIMDDGCGMDEGGLASFYRMGDSPKLQDPVSPKGRRMVGKHGIASLVLKTLGLSYTLQTSRKGRAIYTVREDLTLEGDDSKPIIAEVGAAAESSGTNIVIRGLRFLKEGRELYVEQLRRKLAVEMPVLPDFVVYLNGEEVKPRRLANGVEYKIDLSDSLIGEVKGSIWYASQKLPSGDAGIYVKVNGRAVGGSDISSFMKKAALASRVFGIIHADGLDSIVGFDRDDFIRDHPMYQKLRAHIMGVLKNVRQDMEMEEKHREITDGGKIVAEVASAMGERLQGILNSKIPYEVIINSSKAGKIASLDREEGMMYLNPNSPFFSVQKVTHATVASMIIAAAQYAAGRELVPQDLKPEFDRVTLVSRGMTRSEKEIPLSDLVEDATAKSEVTPDGEVPAPKAATRIYRISAERMYTTVEVDSATGFTYGVLRRMNDSGIIKDDAGRFRGSDISALVRKMEGKVPLYVAIRKVFSADPATNYAQFFSNQETTKSGKLRELAEEGKLPSYVTNMAPEGKNPFWAVDQRFFDSFEHFLRLGKFPEEMFSGKYFSLCSVTTGRKNSGEGVLVYAFEVADPKSPLEIVRESVLHELDSVRGHMPAGVKTVSYLSDYEGSKVVLGVFTGPVAKAADDFRGRGFEQVPLPGLNFTDIYNAVSGNRSTAMPLTSTKVFNEAYAPVVKALYEARTKQ
ncbi:MAG TPA: ATP-binding protein [Candidatus Nanoarchaeia archaeon]|nr:ATP-binding protein [Candidatus Nanoarchaeia archaeon]